MIIIAIFHYDINTIIIPLDSELSRHARETIPIAARQGKHNALYSEAGSWAERMMEIGTQDAVASGQYDEEYLREAGTAPKFRKGFQRLYNDAKSQNSEEAQGKSEKSEQPCPECVTLQEVREWLEKRRAEHL
jgi:hypothetical protein